MSTTADEERPILDMAPTRTVSYGSLLLQNSFSSVSSLAVQLGLAVWAAALWRVLLRSPVSLFIWHPMFNSVAVVAFCQGVLLLQPAKTAAAKETGLTLHQAFQYTGLPLILVGTTLIIYNKLIHSAPHFASWHGKFGIATLSLILIQIIVGAVLVYIPLTKLVGGEHKAKSFWKYHRMSGYLTLGMLLLTPASAIRSDWLVSNTTMLERNLLAGGLAVSATGLVARINFSKWGFGRQ